MDLAAAMDPADLDKDKNEAKSANKPAFRGIGGSVTKSLVAMGGVMSNASKNDRENDLPFLSLSS